MTALAIILGLLGIAGCILPVIPGPPLSWAALLLLYFKEGSGMSLTFLMVWLAITIAVTVLDYIIPAYFTKMTGGSKAAARGSLIGLFVGLIFFPPWGMIVGSFLGAFASEVLISGRDMGKSLKSAFGSFLGFLFSTGLKLTCCGVMMYYIFTF